MKALRTALLATLLGAVVGCMPPAITQRLQDAVAKVLESPEAAQRFASAGAVPRYLGSAALTAYEETEIKKWGEAIRFSGARID